MSLKAGVMRWFGNAQKSGGPSRWQLPWSRRKNALPREDVLRLRPARNPAVTWTEVKKDDEDSDADAPDRLVLSLPTRDDKFGRIMRRIFGAPPERRIELDEFGSQVWILCDGKHTVDELVRFTCETYKLNRRQGEVSVVAFMQMLSQRRLIGYMTKERDVSHGGPKPSRSKSGRQRRTTGRRPRRH